MRHLLNIVIVLGAGVLPTVASAAEQGPAIGTLSTFEVETIATSNALDDESEFGDRALHLRGAVVRGIETDLGAFRLLTGFDVTRFDRYDYANDSSFDLQIEHNAEIAERWTLRTSAGYAVADEGDDLNLGLLRLATRQTTQRVHIGSTLGLKLSGNLLAALTVSNRYDAVGDARFQLPLPDTRLTPDRNVASAALSLATAGERIQYAVTVEAMDVSLYHQVPLQNAVPFESYALRGRMIVDDYAGWTLSGEIGLRRIRDGLGLFDDVRPVYALAISREFPGGVTLKAALDCDFETEDTDDPLATYWRRLSVEGVLRLTENLEAGAGAFIGVGENLLLENEERDQGVYGAIAYAFNPRLSLLLRADYLHKHYTIVDLEHETLSARLGIRTRL